jgi:hypothetical protein
LALSLHVPSVRNNSHFFLLPFFEVSAKNVHISCQNTQVCL